MSFVSRIYRGIVVHDRQRPKRHRLRYRVFSLLIDLEELPRLDRSLRFFGYNRLALLSFFDRDHGPGDGGPLRPWIEGLLAQVGIDMTGGRVLALCYPRILGYVFNPLTIFYCFDRHDDLTATVYEVSNTFGERHSYVVATRLDGNRLVPQECDKVFYVSPFMPMPCRYRFLGHPPGEKACAVIRQGDQEGHLMTASFRGSRLELSDRTLMRCFFSYPLMTLKVIGAIHWEALRLWLKKVPVHRHVPTPSQAVSIVSAQDNP